MASPQNDMSLVVLGSGGVGKSALTVQFHQQVFVQEYDPTLEDNYVKRHEVDGKTYKLSILDTAGQDEFSLFRENYYKSGEGFIIVCSFDNRSSLDEIKKFFGEIERITEKRHGPIIIAANKADKENRKFEEDAVRNLANQLNLRYIVTSAKTNLNVENLFTEIVREVVQYKLKNPPVPIKKNKKKKGCHIM